MKKKVKVNRYLLSASAMKWTPYNDYYICVRFPESDTNFWEFLVKFNAITINGASVSVSVQFYLKCDFDTELFDINGEADIPVGRLDSISLIYTEKHVFHATGSKDVFCNLSSLASFLNDTAVWARTRGTDKEFREENAVDIHDKITFLHNKHEKYGLEHYIRKCNVGLVISYEFPSPKLVLFYKIKGLAGKFLFTVNSGHSKTLNFNYVIQDSLGNPIADESACVNESAPNVNIFDCKELVSKCEKIMDELVRRQPYSNLLDL